MAEIVLVRTKIPRQFKLIFCGLVALTVSSNLILVRENKSQATVESCEDNPIADDDNEDDPMSDDDNEDENYERNIKVNWRSNRINLFRMCRVCITYLLIP